MAAVGGKMGLDMGHLDRGTHETKWKSPGSMNEFFWNKRTEKTNGSTILGKAGSYLRVPTGGDDLELLKYFYKRTFFVHKIAAG
jgi:hypothetical protein